ncbi:hypothetical protein MHK_005399 [Candidatus Magnetomorum sp. HK-1]|nr:hypothetical protein MHK_005399 [Candidatus Magnetomorum sp. HK-1]
MTCLLANDVKLDQFLRVIKAYQCPEHAALMSFSPALTVFERFQFEEKFLIHTHEGRIFSEEGELKWRRIDHMMRMVYLGKESDIELLNDHSKELTSNIKPRRSDIILWGERTNLENKWIEQQVPHCFNYPIDGNEYKYGRVAIEVESFVDNSGMALFRRFCRVKEIKGETHAS